MSKGKGNTLCVRVIIVVYMLCVPVTPEIYWDVQTSPVVFHGNISLFCNTTLSRRLCKQCTERWYGGKNLELLTFNGLSNNKEKYLTTKNDDGFGLIIRNLSTTDINVPYRCSYGFESYKRVLGLPENFELQPSNDTLNSSLSTHPSTLKLYVEFKLVFPFPKCTIKMNGKNISEESQQDIQKNGLFYTVVIRTEYNTSYPCNTTLNMQCQIGTRDINMIWTNINSSCEDKGQTAIKSSKSRIKVVVIVLSVISTCITILGVWKRRYISDCLKHNYTPFLYRQPKDCG